MYVTIEYKWKDVQQKKVPVWKVLSFSESPEIKRKKEKKGMKEREERRKGERKE